MNVEKKTYVTIKMVLIFLKVPLGAWEVKLAALLRNYDRPTNQPTNLSTRTDQATDHGQTGS